MMLYVKTNKALLGHILFRFSMVGVMLAMGVLSFLSTPQHAFAASACQDGTPIPSTVFAGGREADFCSSHHGLEDTSKCRDGTPIERSAFIAGTERQFCSSHGGTTTDPNYCGDFTKVSESAIQGDRQQDFCSGHGGVIGSPATSGGTGTTTPGTTCGTDRNCPVVSPSTCNNPDPTQRQKCVSQNEIVTKLINPAIKVLTMFVGVIAVIMLIIAGIIYSSAQDDPKRIALAKKIILDVVIGIVAYLLLTAFLNYLLPQGLKQT